VLTAKRKQAGVTLIEVLIVLVIIGIALMLGLPSYKAWLQNVHIRNAAEAILNGLQLTKIEALRRNANVRFTLGPGAGWTIGCATVTAACPATIQSRSSAESSSNVVLTPTPVGTSAVTFNSLGGVVNCNADGTDFLSVLDVDVSTTVLSAADSREMRIVISGPNQCSASGGAIVSGGGLVRMCDPNVSEATDPRKC